MSDGVSPEAGYYLAGRNDLFFHSYDMPARIPACGQRPFLFVTFMAEQAHCAIFDSVQAMKCNKKEKKELKCVRIILVHQVPLFFLYF